MIPGPTLVRARPECKALAKHEAIQSGNTFGARWWTDGAMDAPMLPKGNRKLKSSIIALTLLTITPLVFPYDQFEAGHAAGMYYGAADLQIRAKKSVCGYVIKDSPPTLSTRRAEILSYLTNADRVEFANFMDSEEMHKKLARNQVMLDEMIARFSAEADKKTACGLVIGAISQPLQHAKEEWVNFITNNGPRPSIK